MSDTRVPKIAFTGSPHVGRRIGELAGRHLKKVSLEPGGANNLIVLDDADLDAAASAVALGQHKALAVTPDAARWISGVNLPVDGGLASTYV